MDACWKGQVIYPHIPFIDQVLYSENVWGIIWWKKLPNNNGWKSYSPIKNSALSLVISRQLCNMTTD